MTLSKPVAVDQELDCRGLVCPLPILQTRKALESLQVGQVLKMVSSDLASIVDVQAWTRRTGQELLGYEDRGSLFEFYIRKAR